MAIDTIQPSSTDDDTERESADSQILPDRDISDLTAAGVQAYVRSAGPDSVHLKRRGGRTYLVVDGNRGAASPAQSTAK